VNTAEFGRHYDGQSGVIYAFLRSAGRGAGRVTIATARWCAAAILAGSALQLAAAPRADQPVLPSPLRIGDRHRVNALIFVNDITFLPRDA
jgi:hypothetical protein